MQRARILIFAAMLVVVSGVFVGRMHAQANHVDVVQLDTSIDMWITGYLDRGLSVAEGDGAQALIIVVDTPGGLVDPTLEMMKHFLNTRVPTVYYISPKGAKAASAGVYLAMTTNIIAMAPGTTIGACHPVGEQGQNIDTDLRDKLTNTLAAQLRGAAVQRGHNADWAEKCVRESVSLTEDQAVKANVADFVAQDLNDLLNQLDGRKVTTAAGEVTLHTRGATIQNVDRNFIEDFFHFLLDPNIAVILLNLGLLAITLELYNPGATIPAIVGVICLVLAAIVMWGLPTNWAGVILIIAALVMFVLDIKVTGFVLTLGGIVAFVLGTLLLFRPFTPQPVIAPEVSVSPWVIAGTTGLMLVFFAVVMGAAIRIRRMPAAMGMQTLVGAEGVATTDLNPIGSVQMKSELWTATAETPPIEKGAKVKVVAVEGLRVRVVKG
jgi:membrane-bound serine protease (ClpP class)